MKNSIIVILGLALFILTSCEDVIEVKLSDENLDLFAVEAKITTADNPYIFLYKSLRVDQDIAYPGVSGAVVTVSDNGIPTKSIQLVESSEVTGFYTVPANKNFLGETGKEYTVTIEYDGITLKGSDFLYPVEPIDSIQVRASLRGDKRFLGIFTYGNETPGIGNFYKWDIYINDSLLNSAEYLIVASDELVDGNYVYSFEIFTDFHDPDIEDFNRKLHLGDTVYVNQTSISQPVYNFYYQLINQSFSGGIFSVPPANIPGNFSSSDGKTVLGIFTAHDVSRSNMVIIDESIESQLEE